MNNDNFKYLCDDITFKKIMGTDTDENRKYTQRFLELYFDVPLGSLSDIEILKVTKQKYT